MTGQIRTVVCVGPFGMAGLFVAVVAGVAVAETAREKAVAVGELEGEGEVGAADSAVGFGGAGNTVFGAFPAGVVGCGVELARAGCASTAEEVFAWLAFPAFLPDTGLAVGWAILTLFGVIIPIE